MWNSVCARVPSGVGRGGCGRLPAVLVRNLASVPWQGGLLGPTSTDQHYARQLDLQEVSDMLSAPGLLWRAAEADVKAAGTCQWDSVAQYLGHVKAASRQFLDSNELHDREAIMSTFYELLHEKGQLVLALGATSVGKTFLLTKLEQRLHAEGQSKAAEAIKGLHARAAVEPLSKAAQKLQHSADATRPRRVVRYDARHDGANLVQGLLKAFSKNGSFFDKYAPTLVAVAKLGDAVLGGLGAGKLADSLLDLKALLDKKPPLEDVVESFIATCEAEGSFPCLIVDEANVALTAGSEDEKARTLAALRLLTEYTKQNRRLNVILAASEYSEPYRLSALPFKSDNFTDTVLVPEVPPKEMRALLMDRWGMGSNLATAFMAVWGGHVWAAVKGIERLAAARETFSADQNPIAFSADARDGVGLCVAAGQGAPKEMAAMVKGGGSLLGMFDLLRQLAVNGYAPVPLRIDPRAELVGRANVGGVLTKGMVAPGLPPYVWESTAAQVIVVPTNQATRMLLASHLQTLGSS